MVSRLCYLHLFLSSDKLFHVPPISVFEITLLQWRFKEKRFFIFALIIVKELNAIL